MQQLKPRTATPNLRTSADIMIIKETIFSSLYNYLLPTDICFFGVFVVVDFHDYQFILVSLTEALLHY